MTPPARPTRTYHPATRFHDDYRVGDTFWTPARTITEADIVIFAMVSGDWNPPHTDRVFAAENFPLGQRLAHGMLTASVVSGLLTGRLGYMEGAGLAFAGMQWNFTQPVYIGDTIRAEVEVTAHRPSSSKPDRGFMEWAITVFNQDSAVVARGTWQLVVARRPRMEGDPS